MWIMRNKAKHQDEDKHEDEDSVVNKVRHEELNQ